MKRLVLTVAVLGLLSEISGQEAFKVPEGKSVWLNSAPDALDMAEMYTRSDEDRYSWDELRQYVNVIHYYQGHTLLYPSSNSNFKNNSYLHLSSLGFFRSLKEVFHFDSSIEVGAVKQYACDWANNKLEGMVNLTVESVALVYKAGGDVRYLTIDSSLPGGYECKDATLSAKDVAEVVASWMKDVREKLKREVPLAQPVLIGDVEPYPYIDAGTHKWYVDTVTKEAGKLKIPGFSHYHLDVDMDAVRDYEKLSRDIKEICAYVKSKGIRCGIIMNGADTDTSIAYAESYQKRLVVFKSLGLFEVVDNVVIQSWAMSSDGRQYLPPNVPETDPYTKTNLALHTIKCAYGYPNWDCERYPKP